MGTLFLVRHGQASFGTDDYDRLTAAGFEQARLLGAYLAHRGVVLNAVVTGTLRRQIETAETVVSEMMVRGAPPIGIGERLTGLNEYDPEALVTAFTGAPIPRSSRAGERDPAVVKEHFRTLRSALLAWTQGLTSPVGMPDWSAFQAGAVAALVWARESFSDGNVLMVSSGGPIASAVAAVLLAPPETAVELNLRIRNSAVTEFTMTPKRHHLVSFNSIAHIEQQPDATLATYA